MKHLTILITVLLLCLISSFTYAEDVSDLTQSPFRKEKHVIVMEQGDTFIGILRKLGMDAKSATRAYNTLKIAYDARNLRIGQHLELTGTFDVSSHRLETLDTLSFETTPNTKYVLYTNGTGQFEVKTEYKRLPCSVKVINGTIKETPSASLIKAGVPQYLIDLIMHRLSHSINFRTDVKAGDEFAIKYEVCEKDSEGTNNEGDLLFISFSTKKNTYVMRYYFNGSYYNEKGELDKHLLNINPLIASDLYGGQLTEFKKEIKRIDGLQNGDMGEVKYLTETYIEKEMDVEILDELKIRLSSNVLQAIDEIEVEFNDNDKRNIKCMAEIYIKSGYEQSYKIIGYQAVQEMLNILMEKGYKPFNEKIWVSALISQKVKGVTGQNMVSPFGNAIYNYTNDSIEWKPWSNSIFGL